MKVKKYYEDKNYKLVIESISQLEFKDRSFLHHYYYIKSLNRLSNIRETITYINSIEELKQEISQFQYMKILYELVWAYHKAGDWNKAKKRIEESYEIFNKVRYENLDNKDKQVVNSIINLSGIVNYSLGNLDKAMKSFKKLLGNANDIQNEKVIQGSKINMGLIYMDKGEYKKAINYLLEGLELAEQNHSHPHIRVASNNLTYLYTTIGDLNQAEEYALKTIKIAEKNNDKWGLALILNNMGQIKFKKAKYKGSLDYLDRAYRLMKEFDNAEYMLRILFYKLLIQLDLQNRFNANEILQEMRSYSSHSENLRAELIFQLSEAIYLRHSSLYRHKIEAENKLKRLIDAELNIESEFISYAYLYLTELLLEQLVEISFEFNGNYKNLQEGEQELLLEVEKLSDKILKIANGQQIPELELQVHYVNAHLAIIRLDTDSFSQHLKKAELISQQWGLENVTISKPKFDNLNSSNNFETIGINVVDSINQIIHSLPRLKIMIILSIKPKMTFSQLQSYVDLSSGNLSNHCKILIEKGYVNKTKEIIENKFQTTYSMTHFGMQAFSKYTSKLSIFSSNLK